MSRVQQLATNITELLNSEQTTEEGSPAIRQLLEHKLKMCGQAECEQKELLAGIADACLSPHVTTANARVTLMELVELLEKEGCELAAETKQATFQYILGKIQQRLSEFEDVIFNARIALSKVYQSEGEWTKAAAELQSLPFDQAQRSYDPEFRFEQYVTTMRLYLEADDPTMAMAALQRATPLLTLVKNKQHILMFQLSQARIFDSEHKYIEAANLYQTVAQSEELDANEKARFVGLAINCAVLSAAGPQRSQMLARLYRDKLASDLMTFTVLESMHLRRLIKPKDLEHFEEGLAQHQKAVLGDGKTTILSRAVREHNMFVLSSLYSNI
ncbi:COP9 signalosome complex subunit 4, partial [Linderina macrospora]